MAKTVANLNIQIGANVATLKRDLDRASNSVRKFGRGAMESGKNLGTLQVRVSSLLGPLGRLASAAAAIGAVKFGIGLAADAETAEVAFTTMLGSVEKAKAVLQDLSEFSATTPFQLGELRDASRLLIANNLPAEQLISTMKVLGDISSGTGSSLIELTRIFNKMRATGRVTLENINELMLRNIPIWDILSEKTGKSKDEIRAMATAGTISFELMNETLKGLTTTGGLFADSMKKQSETLSGRLSTLKDNIALLAIEVGNKLLPVFKGLADASIAAATTVRNLDVATVATTAKVVAFTIGFSATLLVVPRVVAGIAAIVKALRTLTVAATFAQAATGVGLAKALIGLAVGAGAAYGVGQAFDSMTGSMEGSSKIARQVTAEMDKIAAAQKEVSDDAAEAARKETEALAAADKAAKEAAEAAKAEAEKWRNIGERIADSVATPLENLRERIAELKEAFGRGVIDTDIFRRAAADAIAEFDRVNEARDAFSRTPSVGAAVRGTAGGFGAVQEGQSLLKDLAAAAKKKEAADKRREKLLEDILDKLDEVVEAATPRPVKEHHIV